jgi:hypothetical protein
MPDLGSLLNQAQKMQQNMEEAQEALAEEIVEGTAGGGAVKVVMTALKQIQSVEIAPEVVDPDDVEMLQDLIMAAMNQALEQADAVAEEKMSGLTGGGMPDLGDLGSLLG